MFVSSNGQTGSSLRSRESLGMRKQVSFENTLEHLQKELSKQKENLAKSEEMLSEAQLQREKLESLSKTKSAKQHDLEQELCRLRGKLESSASERKRLGDELSNLREKWVSCVLHAP